MKPNLELSFLKTLSDKELEELEVVFLMKFQNAEIKGIKNKNSELESEYRSIYFSMEKDLQMIKRHKRYRRRRKGEIYFCSR